MIDRRDRCIYIQLMFKAARAFVLLSSSRTVYSVLKTFISLSPRSYSHSSKGIHTYAQVGLQAAGYAVLKPMLVSLVGPLRLPSVVENVLCLSGVDLQ